VRSSLINILVASSVLALNGVRRDGVARVSSSACFSLNMSHVLSASVFFSVRNDGLVSIWGGFIRSDNGAACSSVAAGSWER
jgi:hypothetical protein